MAAGLRCVSFALPADLVDELAAAALIGEHADQAAPELEALVESVLKGYLHVMRNDTPET